MTISTLSGETIVVTIDGNSLEVTANDLSASTNQTCGYDACVPAVLFLDNKLMAGDSTFGEYIHEQLAAMERNRQRQQAHCACLSSRSLPVCAERPRILQSIMWSFAHADAQPPCRT